MQVQKKVHVLTPGSPHGTLKAMYFDPETKFLYPDVCVVNPQGEILIRTNSLGLRGADVAAGERIGIVWGDSVVFGTHRKSWPEVMNEYGAGCVFLNGGVEGQVYQQVLRNAVHFNERHDVAVNVILLGWHLPGDNKSIVRDLTDALAKIPNPLLATMPTSLNAVIIDRDNFNRFLDGADSGWDERRFRFWGQDEYTVEKQRMLFEHILERNDAVRKVARDLNVPLVDLFEAFDSSRLNDFGEYFFDVAHPRPKTYARFAELVYAAAAPILRGKEPL